MNNDYFGPLIKAMKKLLVLGLLLMVGKISHSQILISLLLGDKLNSDKLEFGLDGGVNFANVEGLPGATNTPRFNIGFYFDFKIKSTPWVLHTGVIVKSTMGSNNLPVYDLGAPELNSVLKNGYVDRRLSYFNVPILAKYQFNNKIYVEGGPQLGLMNQSIDKFSAKIKADDDIIYKVKIRDQYHPLDAGMVIGCGYRLMNGNGMNLGIRYYYGLVDITIDDSTPNQYNRSLYLTVGIPIGKIPKEKAKE